LIPTVPNPTNFDPMYFIPGTCLVASSAGISPDESGGGKK
jgi:hypothetical protein